jgi:hypothetical protein
MTVDCEFFIRLQQQQQQQQQQQNVSLLSISKKVTPR